MITIPLRSAAECRITVPGTAAYLYDLMDAAHGKAGAKGYYADKFANALILMPEDASVRMLTDDIAPTDTEGDFFMIGAKHYIPGIDLSTVQLISTDGLPVVCTAIPARADALDTPQAISYAEYYWMMMMYYMDSIDTKFYSSKADVARTTDTIVIPVQQVDENGYSPLLDSATKSTVTVDFSHHEIHEGDHFLYTDSVTLNNGNTQDYMITTPDTTKWPHMTFTMDGSAITQWQLYEAGNRTGTALQTIGNSNRNSGTNSGLLIHKGTSGGSTDGNLIHQYKSGSATNQSRGFASTRNDNEMILKQNTKYILRVTSSTDGNLTNLRLSWYEHTNS